MAEEDKISTLPDTILCHILSFLETKQSAATSVLSKRWKNLWLSVPSLYFNTTLEGIAENFQFNDDVYTVLLSRDAAVKSFRLNLIYDYPQIRYLKDPINSITQWVNFVVQRGAECLDLRLSMTGWEEDNFLPTLPITVFTCKTLVVLKLFSYGVQFSSSVLLPSLKTLHLQHVWFPKLQDFMLFLIGCSILEDLLTYDLDFDSEESLTCNQWKSFCLTNLTRADIDCFHGHFTLKAVHNVPSMRFEIDQVYSHNEFFIPTFHNLTQLELLSLNYSWRFLLQILNHCPMLQKLDIDEADVGEETWTRKDDKENWVDPDVVPQCLSLHLRTCDLVNFLGLQGELLLAKYILKNAKVLQTMRIWNWGQPNIHTLLSTCPRASAIARCRIFNCGRR